MPLEPIHPLPTLDNGKSKREFYVAFCCAHEVPWWMRPFTREEFQHCFVMAQVGPVCCAVEQSNYAIVQHTYWDTVEPGRPLEAALLASVWADLGYTIVKIETVFTTRNRVWHACNALPSCVNLCKNLLGVNCWAQSPYGLYRWLLKNGGTVVKGIEHGRPIKST